MTSNELKQLLPFFDLPLVNILLLEGTLMEIPKNQEIIKQDGYLPGVPIVLEGLVKVATRSEEKTLLLYYIKPAQSCVMSFSSCLKGVPSAVFATTEVATKILLLPLSKIKIWLKEYPNFNALFYAQFDMRYTDLLHNVKLLSFNKFDRRLYAYLKEKTAVLKADILKMTHQEIADDLATAREVVSRTLQKLESEHKINQTVKGITIL